MEGYTKIKGSNNTSSNKSRSIDISSDLGQSFPQKPTNENLSPNHTTFHEVQIKKIDLESISKNKHTKNQETTHDENENENENENESENENENEDAFDNVEKIKGTYNNIPSGGVKLSRACSVSSTTSANRFRLERQGSKRTTSFESVKRVFSMRRSSSVSERYCRIHDQGFTIASPRLDDVAEAHEGMDQQTRSKKKSGSGRILKACKRLFGF